MRKLSCLITSLMAIVASESIRCDDILLSRLPPVEVTPITTDAGSIKPPTARVSYENEYDTFATMREQTSLDHFQPNLDVFGNRARVTTRDEDWTLTIFGALTGEMIYAEQRGIIPSAILFLSPFTGRDTPTVDIHGKQSSLGFELQGPEIFGMQSRALVLTFFYGESLLADQQGLFIPRGFAELKNDRWRFAMGALGEVINPRRPGSLNFVTGQGGGNLGAFRGQFRVERYVHFNDNSQLTTQFCLGNPISTSFVGDIRTLVEDTGWPNLEARIMLGLGPLRRRGPVELRPFEVGFSGLGGQIRRTGLVRAATFKVWAIGADARIELTDNCGFKAEFFHGQAIGNYNAAILQIFNPITLEAIRTTGGWAELFVHWSESLHSHFGFGVDDPLDRTLSPGLRTRNQFAFANLIWEATRHLQIGFEIGRHQTDYVAGATDGVIPILDNESMVFRTRVRLQF